MKYQQEPLSKFSSQVKFAYSSYKPHLINLKDINNIILAGLGGSGIAGRIVKTYFSKFSTVPIEVVSDYKLPNYVNKNTLVILNSYSGNTEETLSAYMDAQEKEAKMLVITTGGLLFELASENKIKCYMAEKGFQPRMALGYSLTYLFLILAELFKMNVNDDLEATIKHLTNTDYFTKKATDYFKYVKNGIDYKWIIITDPEAYPIGIRFAQQLNENAKAEAFVKELPESNHNVIESYYGKLNSIFVFINSKQNEKINYRFEFLELLLLPHEHNLIDINIDEYHIQNIYESIYILDWISLLLADKKKVRSDEIANINKLKEFMKDK